MTVALLSEELFHRISASQSSWGFVVGHNIPGIVTSVSCLSCYESEEKAGLDEYATVFPAGITPVGIYAVIPLTWSGSAAEFAMEVVQAHASDLSSLETTDRYVFVVSPNSDSRDADVGSKFVSVFHVKDGDRKLNDVEVVLKGADEISRDRLMLHCAYTTSVNVVFPVGSGEPGFRAALEREVAALQRALRHPSTRFLLPTQQQQHSSPLLLRPGDEELGSVAEVFGGREGGADIGKSKGRGLPPVRDDSAAAAAAALGSYCSLQLVRGSGRSGGGGGGEGVVVEAAWCVQPTRSVSVELRCNALCWPAPAPAPAHAPAPAPAPEPASSSAADAGNALSLLVDKLEAQLSHLCAVVAYPSDLTPTGKQQQQQKDTVASFSLFAVPVPTPSGDALLPASPPPCVCPIAAPSPLLPLPHRAAAGARSGAAAAAAAGVEQEEGVDAACEGLVEEARLEARGALQAQRRALLLLLALPPSHPAHGPCLRLRCALPVAGGAGGAAGVGAGVGSGGAALPLLNVHVGLGPSGLSRGEQATVRGPYRYYHYLQQRADDKGWGCAYRSLQTIVSWFRLNGFSEVAVPGHRTIQRCLVSIGDKPASFVGSKQWIGSLEVGYVLDTLLGVSFRSISVSSGDELNTKARELLVHFRRHGTPVMMGGGQLAFTVLGVAFDDMSGDARFLILDPHYTGVDDSTVVQTKVVTMEGYKATAVGWRSAQWFTKNSLYNLCLPQRPTAEV